jgi:carboxymethylenebutenolidase
MGRDITLERADGGEAAGYLADAARPDAPGVVMVQEWWGLQGQFKRLAGDGYNVVIHEFAH